MIVLVDWNPENNVRGVIREGLTVYLGSPSLFDCIEEICFDEVEGRGAVDV